MLSEKIRNSLDGNLLSFPIDDWADEAATLETSRADLLEALEQAKGAVEWMAGATDSDPEDHKRLELVNKAIAAAKGDK